MPGCTPRELAVLDRSDDGMSHEDIAAELGMPIARVRNIVRYYDGGQECARVWRRAAEVANAHHVAAIVATGRSFA
jgi:DNA-directed RNA polymerase specialized sigma24 family protein